MINILSSSIVIALFIPLAGCSSIPFIGGDSGEEEQVELAQVRDFINRQIKNPVRAKALLGLVSNAEDQIAALNRLHLETEAAWFPLQANYRTTTADMENFLAGTDRKRIPLRNALVDTLVAMKEKMTRTEWAALSDIKTADLLQNMQRTSTATRTSHSI